MAMSQGEPWALKRAEDGRDPPEGEHSEMAAKPERGSPAQLAIGDAGDPREEGEAWRGRSKRSCAAGEMVGIMRQ